MDRTARGVLDIARSVLAELDLEVVLNRVLESARELTGARYAALGVLGSRAPNSTRFLTIGIDELRTREIGALPRGRGVLGELIAHPTALRLTDISEHPRSYGFPHGHPPMRSFLGVPVMIGGTPFGNLYLTEKQEGEQFSEADEEAVDDALRARGIRDRPCAPLYRRQGAPRRAAANRRGTQRDHTDLAGGRCGDRSRRDPRARRQARTRARRRALAGDRARTAWPADGSAGAGELPDGLLGQQVPLGDSAASAALRTRQAQRLQEQLTRARFDEHGLGTLGVKAHGGLLVPLVFQQPRLWRARGRSTAYRRVRSSRADDERLLEAFAASAATAVATAQSVASERRRQRLAAAEGERQRWARELHDDTLQSLSALRVGLSTAKRSGRPEALEQAVTNAIDHLEEGITNLRALITDLRPASLDELGAAAAIQALAERAERTASTWT